MRLSLFFCTVLGLDLISHETVLRGWCYEAISTKFNNLDNSVLAVANLISALPC